MTALAGQGLLSFEDLTLPFDSRVTLIVGPNGVGKTNLLRLIELCVTAVLASDHDDPSLMKILTAFFEARRRSRPVRPLVVRLAYELTTDAERDLITQFVRAAAVSAVLGNYTSHDSLEIDRWARAEITPEKLQDLFAGNVVVAHSGRSDSAWRCWLEFHNGAAAGVRWYLLGSQRNLITRSNDADSRQRNQETLAFRLTGRTGSPTQEPSAPRDEFSVSMLLPSETADIACPLDARVSGSDLIRDFVEEHTPDLAYQTRAHFSFATPMGEILRRAVVRADTVPGPVGGTDPTAILAVHNGDLPTFLFRLKNGDGAETRRFRSIQELFYAFTQGRSFDIRLVQVPNGDALTETPSTYVSSPLFGAGDDERLEVPLLFAGSGASQALVLATALSQDSASVVLLDEPGVGLHPTLQREIASHLRDGGAQFIVATHSVDLLPEPLEEQMRLHRADLDELGATRMWILSTATYGRIRRKLRAKGNERLPFAHLAVLCEGETDVVAIRTVADLQGFDIDRRNVAVVDCGGRENLPDYIRFCAELGLRHLTVMDGDRSTASKDKGAAVKSSAVRAAMASSSSGTLFEFEEDLEHALGLIAKSPAAVRVAVEGAVTSKAPEIIALVRALKRFLEE